jgi:hypothetical protein
MAGFSMGDPLHLRQVMDAPAQVIFALSSLPDVQSGRRFDHAFGKT